MVTEFEGHVFLVDDDEAVRDALTLLLESVGLRVDAFESAADFLGAYNRDIEGVLVLDIRMPGMSGMELQEKLLSENSKIPIVFITGHGDIPMAVEAMQKGAVDFLTKPFRDQDLLDRINVALRQQQEAAVAHNQQACAQERMTRLTPREREVMDMVVKGAANKVIAQDLSLSQRTVEIHRARVMEKLEVRTLADLVRLSIASGVS